MSSESPMMMFPPKCNFILFENQKPHFHPDVIKIEHYKKMFNGRLEMFLAAGVILSVVSLVRIYTSFSKKQQVKPPVPPPVALPQTQQKPSALVTIMKLLFKISMSAYTHLVIGIILIAVFSAEIQKRKKFYDEFKKDVIPNCSP